MFSLNSIFVKNTNSLRPKNPIGEPFIELSEVDSTNNYAMRQVQAQMAEHGSAWFAWFQSSGKGQRGKAWNAEEGKNIMMSFVLEPTFLDIDTQFLLNVTVALACHDFFNSYAISDTTIKWPNDIYWKDRKAGGILIENLVSGKNWRFSIVGTGININQTLFPDTLPNPVSLKQITGITFDVLALAKELCKKLDNRWKQLKNKKYDDLLVEYNTILYKANQKVTLEKDNATFEAIVNGVNKSGELIVSTGKGETSAISFGEATWKIG